MLRPRTASFMRRVRDAQSRGPGGLMDRAKALGKGSWPSPTKRSREDKMSRNSRAYPFPAPQTPILMHWSFGGRVGGRVTQWPGEILAQVGVGQAYCR